MTAPRTIGKALTENQNKAFEEARKRAGLTKKQATEIMLQMFCEANGVEWPKTGKHGGARLHNRHE